MYLVEIEAGREAAVRVGRRARRRPFAAASSGPESRIFHRASSSWVSITVHPEYKKVMADLASEPLPPLARKQWTFFGLEPSGREIDDTTRPTGRSRARPPMPPSAAAAGADSCAACSAASTTALSPPPSAA